MSAKLHYPWQRRWLPLNPGAESLARPYEPDTSGYVNLQRQGLTLDDSVWLGTGLGELTEQNRCVVLLGEPGIGKSQEWQSQKERLGGQPGQVFMALVKSLVQRLNGELVDHHFLHDSRSFQ